MSDEQMFSKEFNVFFESLDGALTQRLKSIRRKGFPKSKMEKLLSKAKMAVIVEKDEIENLDNYFSSSNQPIYASLIFDEMLFFTSYIENFMGKKGKTLYENIKDQIEDYKVGARMLWKPLLDSLKVFLESLKEFLENHPNLKGVLSVYCELLGILA